VRWHTIFFKVLAENYSSVHFSQLINMGRSIVLVDVKSAVTRLKTFSESPITIRAPVGPAKYYPILPQ